ncbi:MAG: histidine kinase, partial [Lachnospiraceae bacterium]|nr:histidine kinase [Lachnospiraceae bacterium]
MFDSLPTVLMIVFEVFCCKIFFEVFGKVRYKGWINAVQLILLVSGVFGAVKGFGKIFVLKQTSIILIFAGFMFWHVKISIKKSLILAVLYQALLLSADYIAFLIYYSGLVSSGETTSVTYVLESVLVVLFGKMLLYFCVLIIRKKFGKKSTEMLVESEWLKFLFFPIFTIIVMVAMFSVFGYVETTEQVYLLFIIAFGMAGMNIVEFYLINDIIEREIKLHENKIFEIQVKNQTEMYQSISENFDSQKRKTHEYKNQIVCIESLLGNKKYPELEKYVKEIYGHLDKELDA